jgi:hypothetical protein
MRNRKTFYRGVGNDVPMLPAALFLAALFFIVHSAVAGPLCCPGCHCPRCDTSFDNKIYDKARGFSATNTGGFGAVLQPSLIYPPAHALCGIRNKCMYIEIFIACRMALVRNLQRGALTATRRDIALANALHKPCAFIITHAYTGRLLNSSCRTVEGNKNYDALMST